MSLRHALRPASTARIPSDGRSLRDFIRPGALHAPGPAPAAAPGSKAFYIETYGCQMNVADSQIAESILASKGYSRVWDAAQADALLVNTCSVRDKPEERVWERLKYFRTLRSRGSSKASAVAVLGCMAEWLKDKILDQEGLADVVVGPDAYRSLPDLLDGVLETGSKGINVQLSLDETYADIAPVRRSSEGLSAFVSVMRGCNNMCAFCIVPFTRGRERSRPLDSIVAEVSALSNEGFREVTLLGQNVNSYNDFSAASSIDDADPVKFADGFKSNIKVKAGGKRFASLLRSVAEAVGPEVRVRFTSPHPKDFPDEVLEVIASYPNVCKQIHLPAQSGSDRILEKMRRGYTRSSYLKLVEKIRKMIPGVYLSSDFISGFSGESDEDHQDTVRLIREVRFDQAFMFAYSEREKTHAYHRMPDDVPADVKNQRLNEVIEAFNESSKAKSQEEIGRYQIVLVEGDSKRSPNDLAGRNDGNKKVIFPKVPILPQSKIGQISSNEDMLIPKRGDYVVVKIENASQTSFKAQPVCLTSISEYSRFEH